MYTVVSLTKNECLSGGNCSYIVRLSVRDLHGPTLVTYLRLILIVLTIFKSHTPMVEKYSKLQFVMWIDVPRYEYKLCIDVYVCQIGHSWMVTLLSKTKAIQGEADANSCRLWPMSLKNQPLPTFPKTIGGRSPLTLKCIVMCLTGAELVLCGSLVSW